MKRSHTGAPPWPTMVEASLDEAKLQQLLNDWQHHATLLAVRQKGAATTHAAENNPAELAAAVHALRTRSCRAIQVEYLFEGVSWTDTLFAVALGYRLIRCRHDPPR
ncbi:MAG: hypothetical protein N2039_00045 [Gemmataceae bacterium]|nr:hypothetical protein [Gemmataceae bacterium]